MAYPSVDAPYGMIPVNMRGGTPYSGGVRHIPIASGYSENIFTGDPVKTHTDGTVIRDDGTTTTMAVGVFMGCQYTDAARGLVNSTYWPDDQVASDAVALVVDDPNVVFKIALVSGTTVMAGATRAELVGGNGTFVQNKSSGSTVTGKSKLAMVNSVATTTSLPIRVVDVVEETMDGTDYTEVLVTWNPRGKDVDTAMAAVNATGSNS